jgi:hypothetical protein
MPPGGIGAALQNLMGMLRGVNGLEEWGAAMENMDDEARVSAALTLSASSD